LSSNLASLNFGRNLNYFL